MQAEPAGVTLAEFKRNWRKCWIVERGPEIVSEASRRLPDDLRRATERFAWRRVAGLGDALRHEYRALAADVLWLVVRDDFDQLLDICQAELAVADRPG